MSNHKVGDVPDAEAILCIPPPSGIKVSCNTEALFWKAVFTVLTDRAKYCMQLLSHFPLCPGNQQTAREMGVPTFICVSMSVPRVCAMPTWVK